MSGVSEGLWEAGTMFPPNVPGDAGQHGSVLRAGAAATRRDPQRADQPGGVPGQSAGVQKTEIKKKNK